MRKYIYYTLLLALAFFLFLMIRITIPYFQIQDDVAFLRIKQPVIDNHVWKSAFYIHVFSACFCLLAGFTQFSKGLQKNKPNVHRRLGYLYIIILLVFSAPSGLVMSVYANGGIFSQISFSILSILWIVFTAKGLIEIKKGNILNHKKFLWRSYALTLSAITLRLWKLGLALTLHPHPMDLYRWVAWLGWVPNLIIVELMIIYYFNKRVKHEK
ncbi:MAG: DUF2306 domain-containing protein [Reichenbachiella sp.]